jgi:hypothetical protein
MNIEDDCQLELPFHPSGVVGLDDYRRATTQRHFDDDVELDANGDVPLEQAVMAMR